jgi:hypothetical protein
MIGPGHRGPITTRLQTAFFDIISGNAPDAHGWLMYVDPQEADRRSSRAASGAGRSA